MKIGQLTTGAGVATTFQLSYLPEKIRFIANTVPASLTVNVLGVGIITDLDANGIIAFGKRRKIDLPANAYEIPLADGIIMGRNVEITFVNSAAQTPAIYVDSNNVGGLGYVQCLRQTVFASTPFEVGKFAMLGLQNSVVADQLDITYADGTVQKTAIEEFPFMVGNYQSESGTCKVLDNLDTEIKTVRFIPASNEVIYIMSYLFTDLAKSFSVTR